MINRITCLKELVVLSIFSFLFLAQSAASTPPQIQLGFDLTADAASKSGSPGEKITFLLTINNTGNAPDAVIIQNVRSEWNFSVRKGSEALTLPYPIQPSSLLEPGQKDYISLDVVIPSSANAGEAKTVTINAHSYADPFAVKNVTVSAQAASSASSPPSQGSDGSSAGTGSSGGGSSGSGNVIANPADTNMLKFSWPVLESGKSVEIKIQKGILKNIIFSVKTGLSGGQMEVRIFDRLDILPPADSTGFGYFEINTNIKNSDLESVSILFNLNTSFLKKYNIDKSSVSAYKLIDGKWQKLATKHVSETPDEAVFEAQTNSFSVFGIFGLRKPALSPIPSASPEKTMEIPAPTKEPDKPSEQPSPPSAFVIGLPAGIAGSIVLVFIVVFILRRKFLRRRNKTS